MHDPQNAEMTEAERRIYDQMRAAVRVRHESWKTIYLHCLPHLVTQAASPLDALSGQVLEFEPPARPLRPVPRALVG